MIFVCYWKQYKISINLCQTHRRHSHLLRKLNFPMDRKSLAEYWQARGLETDSKSKVPPPHAYHEGIWGTNVYIHLFLALVIDGSELPVSNHRYSLNRRMDLSQSQSGYFGENKTMPLPITETQFLSLHVRGIVPIPNDIQNLKQR